MCSVLLELQATDISIEQKTHLREKCPENFLRLNEGFFFACMKNQKRMNFCLL